MHLRKLERWIYPAAFAAGLAASPGFITPDAGRMLVTFVGLVAASILPTISLLIGSMTATGRSVLAIDELNLELKSAMDALFLLFGSAAIVMGALVSLSIAPPPALTHLPWLTSETLPRAGQAIVVLFASITVVRFGQVPAILRRSLVVRHKIAADEARRKTLENAPAQAAVRAAFQTHPDFGKTVRLEEVTGETGRRGS